MTEGIELWEGSPYTVTPAERAAIRAGAEQHVKAVVETERAVRRTFRADSGHLFDPVINPAMHEWVNAVIRHLHTSQDIKYIDRRLPGMRPYDQHQPNAQGHTFVHFVGMPDTVLVFREPAERFAWLWSAINRGFLRDNCDLAVSPLCTGGREYPYLDFYVPVQRGQFLLMFESCPECYDTIEDAYKTGMRRATAEAWAAAQMAPLPKWARRTDA